MATFYDEIAENKRNSILLALVVVALLAALGFSVGYALTGSSGGGVGATVLAVIVGTLAALGSYYGGDSLVLAASQAKEVDEQSAPQLMNVVREMAIAANVPMPKVYVIDDTAPNAFATGRDPNHASVAVTTGLLEKLDREELQGVLGHELSHVFLRWTWFGGGGRRSRDREGGGGLQAIMFVIAIALAILAPLAGRLVQMAVSRQREYL